MNQGVRYDAMVVGTGITGGWAARELCENGFNALVIEKGLRVKQTEGYPAINTDPSNFPYGAIMASASCVTPSLTYIAFTARAADQTARENRAGRLS